MMTRLQARGLLKIGDVLCPGDGERWPRFSALPVAEIAPVLLGEMDAQDRNDFLMLLGLFGLLPGFLVHGLYGLIEKGAGSFGVFRLLRLGVRGFVFAIYYSEEAGCITELPYSVNVPRIL
jgi:hypothetical protein